MPPPGRTAIGSTAPKVTGQALADVRDGAGVLARRDGLTADEGKWARFTAWWAENEETLLPNEPLPWPGSLPIRPRTGAGHPDRDGAGRGG